MPRCHCRHERQPAGRRGRVVRRMCHM
jgi:hypothetical protein